jgi:hypothetical protein
LKQRNNRNHRAMIAVLVAAREVAGLPGREVSRRLGRPVNFCHRVESGERMLSMPEFIEYAQVLEADPVKLLREIIARI